MSRIMAACLVGVLCLSGISNDVFCSQRTCDSPCTSSDEDSRDGDRRAVSRIGGNAPRDESDELLSADVKLPMKRVHFSENGGADSEGKSLAFEEVDDKIARETLVTPPSTPKKKIRLTPDSVSTPPKNPSSIASFFGRSGFTPVKKSQSELKKCDSVCIDISDLPWTNITEVRAKNLANNSDLQKVILPNMLTSLDHLLECAAGRNFLAVFSSEVMNNIFKPCRIVPRGHEIQEDLASAGVSNQIHAVVISSGQLGMTPDDIRHSVKLPRSDKDKMNAIVCRDPKSCTSLPDWCRVVIAWFPNFESIQTNGDLLYKAKRNQWISYPDLCWGMLIRNGALTLK